MLKWNEAWDIGEWQTPEQSPRELVEAYAEMATQVPGILGVWAKVIGATLNIYTLVQSEGGAEKQAYRIELQLSDKWLDLPVQFHVYRDKSALKEAVRDAQPILIAA